MERPTHTASPITRDTLLGSIRDFVNSLTETKVRTRRTYERSLREFVRWFDQDGSLLFAVDDIYRYRQYLSHSKRLADTSISTYLSSLRQFCGYLLDRGIISYNPAKHIRIFVSRQRTEPACLEKDDVDRLLGLSGEKGRRGQRDCAILRLMVQHGMTEVELAAADVGDFVFIGGAGALKLHDGGMPGRILLDATTAGMIHDYLASREDPRREHPLFISDGNRTRGMRMTTRGIRARVNYCLQLAGVRREGSKISPQTLKHTAAMLMADAGYSADEIKYRMRFGSLARAMQYTGRVDPGTHSHHS